MVQPKRKARAPIVAVVLILTLFVTNAALAQFAGTWGKWGKSVEDYEVGGDPTVARGTAGGGFIQSIVPEPRDFGTLSNSVKPGPFIGKRVRLSGFIKSENVRQWVGFWMRVDGPNGHSVSFDNMEYRPIVGTADWKKYDVVLDVPTGSVNIALGVLLVGKGKAWIDGVIFDTVSTDVPVTTIDPFADYYAGRLSDAAKVFQMAARNNPEDLYSRLFYFLSLYRNGQVKEAQGYVTKVADDVKEEKWVVPVLRFYAGKVSEKELLEAASSKDSTTDIQQKCEAYFYIGMAYLLDMEEARLSEHPGLARAKEYFEKCVATGQTDFIEYKGAQVELGKGGK